jgi:hypothetical protein
MTKPLALIGTIGQTTNLLNHSTLQTAEMAAMGRIAESQGYEAVAATKPSEKQAKFPSGLVPWDGKTPVDLVWIHQQTPNYMGGPGEAVCENIGIIAEGLKTAKKVFRLVVDNNETMRHKSVYGVKKRKECASFPIAGELIEKKIEEGVWTEVGIPECADPDAGLPFIYVPITSTQLILTKEIWGTKEEKTFDFGYIGTSRANKKKQEARLASLGEFLDHENSLYSGSLFKKKCGFTKGWEQMSQVKAQLIVRDPGMNQTPLHRYVQALMHDAIPIVLNESSPVAFIHSEVLQDALRVTSLAEGLDLVKRREELLPLLREERDYWLDYDQSRGPGF